jgi:hypothetical protein
MSLFAKPDPRTDRLRELELVLEKTQSYFVAAAEALAEIRDQRLYRLTHNNFADYIRERWHMTVGRAYQLIAAGAAAANVQHAGQMPNARQAEALAGAPPAKQPEVWAEILSTAPTNAAGAKKITAEHVAAVVAKVSPKRKKKTRRPKPIRVKVPGGIIIIERRADDTSPERMLIEALDKLRNSFHTKAA